MSMEVSTDRTQHIADLTRQIEAGTYRVSADKIVTGMLDKPYRDLNLIERELIKRALQHQNRQARLNIYRAKAKELQTEAAAQSVTHCPVHGTMFTLRTGDRYTDCLRCARWKAEHFSQESGMVPCSPDPSDDAYGGGWSAYHGKVTWFDWACVAASVLIGAVLLVMVLK
jgi:hypothetical protein